MGIKGEVERPKRLMDMDVGEDMFAPDFVLLADLKKNPYICVNAWATNISDKFELKVIRYGEGLDEFDFTCKDRRIVVNAYREPIYDPAEFYYKLENGPLIVPMEYGGSILDYFEEFFPDEVDDYKEYISDIENYKKEAYESRKKSSNIPLESRFPKTHQTRKRLGIISRSDTMAGRNVTKFIKECEAGGEPLTPEELYGAFNVPPKCK